MKFPEEQHVQEGATHVDHVAASRAFRSWARLFSSSGYRRPRGIREAGLNQSINQSIDRSIDRSNKQANQQTNQNEKTNGQASKQSKQKKQCKNIDRYSQTKKETKQNKDRNMFTVSLCHVVRIMQNVQVDDTNDASALAASKDAEVSFSASVLLTSSQQT